MKELSILKELMLTEAMVCFNVLFLITGTFLRQISVKRM